MFAENAVYINSPVSELEQRVFTDIIKLLDFDFGGIDYAYMPNGEIVIWEVNPHRSLGGTEEPIKSRITNLLSSYYSDILATKIQITASLQKQALQDQLIQCVWRIIV